MDRRTSNTKIITYDNLFAVRSRHKGERVVLVTGAFDLLHPGHILFFENAKTAGDILVAGVGSDQEIKSYKAKERPFYAEQERLKSVAALEAVDYAFITAGPKPEEVKGHFLLDVLIKIFRSLRPDIYVFNKDTFEIPYRLQLAEAHQVAVKILDDFYVVNGEMLSTTKILERLSAMAKLR